MKKNIILLLLLIGVFLSCKTQKLSLNRGETPQNHYYATIPFEWIDGKIIVPVEINGKTYRFMFDTGAFNTVSETLYKELNMPVLFKNSVTDQSGKKDSIFFVNMDNITLGNVLFRDIPAGVMSDSNYFAKCLNIDGIVGSNMLRNSVVQLSLPDKTIKLTDNFKKLDINQENSRTMQLSPDQSLPIVTIGLFNVNDSTGITEELLFDTGASNFYSLCLRNFETFSAHHVFKQIDASTGSNTIGLYGNADNILHYRLLFQLISINNAAFTNVLSVTTSGNNSRIGSEILKYGNVTLDYKNKTFNFEPFSNEDNDMYKPTFPIDITLEGNQLLVGFVWDDDLKDVISVGDRILFIDETDYRNIDPCDLLINGTGVAEKNKATITFEKANGSIHKIDIKKKITTNQLAIRKK